MRKAIIVYEEAIENSAKVISGMLKKRFILEGLCIKDGGSKKEYSEKLLKCKAGYICTLDMAGFQLDTLLGEPTYDILTAKQMHIIINEDILSLYGENDFALNLFLYIPDDVEKWRKRYPHIPNMESYKRFEADENGNILNSEINEAILNLIVDRTIQEAEG